MRANDSAVAFRDETWNAEIRGYVTGTAGCRGKSSLIQVSAAKAAALMEC
jgi:hypothetical protein